MAARAEEERAAGVESLAEHRRRLIDERRRRAGVADAEPGHGPAFGKSMQEYGPLAHPRKRGDRHMLRAIVGQFSVDFVREDDEVMLLAEGGDRLKCFTRHGRAGRVGREIE